MASSIPEEAFPELLLIVVLSMIVGAAIGVYVTYSYLAR